MGSIKAAIDAFFNWPPTVKMNTHAHHCYCVETKRNDGVKSWLYYEREDDASMAMEYYKNNLVEARIFSMMEIVE